MEWRSACVAVIPCLNEQRAIGSVVREVREHVETVLVVDDGSNDGTAEAAQAAGAQVLRHGRPEGKGVALKSGLAWAGARGFSWVLSLDGDGQHLAEDIPRFFQAAHASRADLLIGNRMSAAKEIPWLRRKVNQWMSARISALAGRRLEDTQCGFRLMRVASYARLRVAAARFEVESEVLLAFVRAGFEVTFVPVQVVYRSERSKIRPVLDTLRWFRWYFRARSSRSTA